MGHTGTGPHGSSNDSLYTNGEAMQPPSMEEIRAAVEKGKQIQREYREKFAHALSSGGFTLIALDLLQDHQIMVSREVYNALKGLTKPTLDSCSICGGRLLYSSRIVGDGLCHPCAHRQAAETIQLERELSHKRLLEVEVLKGQLEAAQTRIAELEDQGWDQK